MYMCVYVCGDELCVIHPFSGIFKSIISSIIALSNKKIKINEYFFHVIFQTRHLKFNCD